MSLRVTVGENVRRVRGKKRMMQKDLAEQIEVTPGYLAHIEKGRKNLTVDVIERLCLALEVCPEALFYNASRTLTKQREAVK